MNEPFFVGHFPEEPVMPGVLIVEAMAQCSGILVLGDVPDPENYSTYFMKIDGVKFKRKVVPGDTLQFEITCWNPSAGASPSWRPRLSSARRSPARP